MKYQFFEHTADAKFKAYGKTLEEAYTNAAHAMFSVITENQVKAVFSEKVYVRGSNLVSLLYNFLEELLFLFDTKSFLLARIKDIEITDLTLSAVVEGDINIDEYEVSGNVKAVTYNEMEVIEKEGHFEIQAVIDL